MTDETARRVTLALALFNTLILLAGILAVAWEQWQSAHAGGIAPFA